MKPAPPDRLADELRRTLEALSAAALAARDQIRADEVYPQARLLIDAQAFLVRLKDAANE